MDRDRRTQLRLTLDDGSRIETELRCGGNAPAHDAVCMDDPRLALVYPTDGGGYRDFPEGSTPFPDPEPDAAAAATPLLIERLTVPIARTGPTRVALGQATLANGIIQQASCALADHW